MRRNLLIVALATVALINPVAAQKFGKKGGVGSNDTVYTNGEPSGGTYSINGDTGAAKVGPLTVTGTVTSSGTVSGTNITAGGNTTGNSVSATKLQTPRNINGVPFDGSAAITINAADSTARLAASANLTDLTNPTSARANIGAAASGANTDITSIAGSAAKLTTPRTITATGDIGYSVSFDGSAPVSATATLSNTTVTAGTYNNASITVDAKGRITSASSGSASSTDAATLGGNNSAYYTNSSNQSSGTLPAGRLPALLGDITTPAGSATTTLATVNGNVGTFGSSTQVPIITVNAKGLVTAVQTLTISGGGGGGSGGDMYRADNLSGLSNYASARANLGATTVGNAVFTATDAAAARSATGAAASGANTDITSITGNAATATKLATGRTLAITGDLSYTSPSFDGSGNVTAAGTLANTAVTPGNYTNASITVDAKGRVTAASSGTASGTGTVTSISVTTANGVSGSVANASTTPAISLSLGAITPSSVAASGAVTGSNLSGTNTGDQTISLSGDVTGSGTASFVTTLATVNNSPGSFGGALSIPTFTVNGKGLVTAAGSVNLGTVPIGQGGTGQTTAAAALSALGAQPASGNLTALAGITFAADRCTYWTSATAAQLYACSSFGRSLVGATNASSAQSSLGLGSAATYAIGTSGANVPLLSAINTWASTQTFEGTVYGKSALTITGNISPETNNTPSLGDGSYRWNKLWIGSGGIDAQGAGTFGGTIAASNFSGSSTGTNTGDQPYATASEIQAATASRVLSPSVYWAAQAPTVLTDSSTIAINLNTGINFSVTIGGNRILALPTNLKVGQSGYIRVLQNSTGGYSLSFASGYRADDNTNFPTLNTAANAVTILRYEVTATGEVTIYGGKPSSGSKRSETKRVGQNGSILIEAFGTSTAVTVSLRGFNITSGASFTVGYDVYNSSNTLLTSGVVDSAQPPVTSVAVPANGYILFGMHDTLDRNGQSYNYVTIDVM